MDGQIPLDKFAALFNDITTTKYKPRLSQKGMLYLGELIVKIAVQVRYKDIFNFSKRFQKSLSMPRAISKTAAEFY